MTNIPRSGNYLQDCWEDSDRTSNDYDRVYNQYIQRAIMNKNMKFKDFEDYLSQVFAEGDGYTCLDDDFPDAFDDWLCKLEPDDYIRFGNKYGEIKKGEANVNI